MTKYKAVVTYRDGHEISGTSFGKESALHMVKALSNDCVRVFKHRGVDYGPHGKLITNAELHDGVKEVKVYEISITNTWDIDPSTI